MNSQPGHRNPAIHSVAPRSPTVRPGSIGPVPRRSFPSIRSEFIQMVDAPLKALAEIDKMCDELLAEFDSRPPPTMWDDEPPTVVEKKKNGVKR
jgi:hypothetical protein